MRLIVNVSLLDCETKKIDLLSIFHWKMFSSLLLPIACIITRRTIATTRSILVEDLFESFGTCARNDCSNTHWLRSRWVCICFTITETFGVVDECSLLDVTFALINRFDLRTSNSTLKLEVSVLFNRFYVTWLCVRKCWTRALVGLVR